jgi:hypothetical protein
LETTNTPKCRTEEEIIGAIPVVVKLGGVEYSIPPLTIRKNREWRL